MHPYRRKAGQGAAVQALQGAHRLVQAQEAVGLTAGRDHGGQKNLEIGGLPPLGLAAGVHHDRLTAPKTSFHGCLQLGPIGGAPQTDEVSLAQVLSMQVFQKAAAQAEGISAGGASPQDENLRQKIGEITWVHA